MNVFGDVRAFYDAYRGEKQIIGYSEEGRGLYAFFLGKRERPVGICQYAIHAREWITCYLALQHLRRGIARGGVWIVPLLNPDGALLSTQGIGSVGEERRKFLLRVNKGRDFSLWKANAEAVDLNVNFAARWGTGRSNLRIPSPENYIGSAPFCAAETAALRDFTLWVRPNFTISWHTKGEEIYWRFHQPPLRALRDMRYARRLQSGTGYRLKNTPHSAGGYKDWCVETLKIPSFTVEVGSDALSHPIGLDALRGIEAHCADVLARFTEGF